MEEEIATNTLKLMLEYLVNEIRIATLQAFVMPENVYSSKVLLYNGFIKEGYTAREKNLIECLRTAMPIRYK